MPEIVKGTLWDFLTFVLLQNIKLKGGPFGDIKHFFKKPQSRKGRKSHSAEKSQNILLRNPCKKNTHGFEHEPSRLKSKHLTTGPRTPELCDLRAETRELSPGKKHPQFPITLLSQV